MRNRIQDVAKYFESFPIREMHEDGRNRPHEDLKPLEMPDCSLSQLPLTVSGYDCQVTCIEWLK